MVKNTSLNLTLAGISILVICTVITLLQFFTMDAIQVINSGSNRLATTGILVGLFITSFGLINS